MTAVAQILFQVNQRGRNFQRNRAWQTGRTVPFRSSTLLSLDALNEAWKLRERCARAPLPSLLGCLVHVFTQERRLSPRYEINIPIKFRTWKSDLPECVGGALNISEGGVCFRTHALLAEGQTVEVRFDMPEEVVDEPTTEWRCTGQVLKVEPVGRLPVFHIRVRFDCYEVARPNGTTTIRIDLNSLRSDPAS